MSIIDGVFEIAYNSNWYFTDTLTNDFVIRTETSNQGIAIGVTPNLPSAIYISKDSITFSKPVNLGSGFQIAGQTDTYSNLTVGSNATICNNLAVYGNTTLCNQVCLESNLVTKGIATFCNNIYAFNPVSLSNVLNVSDKATFSNAMIITSNMWVLGAASLCNNLAISGKTDCSNAVTITSNLWVNGETSLSNNLYVYGRATICNVTSLQSNLVVAGQATLSNNLLVLNSASFSNTLNVSGRTNLSNAVAIASNLMVTGSTSLSNNLNVYGNVTISNATYLQSNLLVTGTTTMCNNLHVLNQTSLSNTFNVSGKADFSNAVIITSNLWVNGGASLSNTLNVSGKADFSNAVTITSNLSVSGETYINSNLNILGNTTISNNAIIQGNIIVAGAATFSNNLFLLNPVTFSNSVNISGITTLSNALAITSNFVVLGTTNLSNNLNVFGTTTMCNLIITGTTTMSNNVLALGPLSFSNTLNVSGKADFSNAVTITSNLWVNGAASISNNLNVYGNTTLCNVTTIQSNLIVAGIATFSNAVNALGPMTALASMTISNAATITSNLWVMGITSLSNNVNVSGRADFSNAVVITSNLWVNGAMSLSNILNVSGKVNISNVVAITSNLWVNGDASLSNNIYVYGTATICNLTAIQSNLVVSGITTLSNNLIVLGSAIFNNPLYVAGKVDCSNAVTITSNLWVNGVTSFSNTLDVSGASTFSNVVRVSSNVDVKGLAYFNNNTYVVNTFSLLATYPPPASTGSFTISNVTVSTQSYGNGLYLVTSSTQFDAFNAPYNAFDNSVTTKWMSAIAYNNASGLYIGTNTTLVGTSNYSGEWIDVALPLSITLSNLRMISGTDALNYGAKDFYVVGSSNNGSSWDLLLAVTGYTSWVVGASGSNQASTFQVTQANNNLYNRFRVIINKTVLWNTVRIQYLALDGYTGSYASMGIRTSNPTEALEVADNAKINSNLYVINNIGIGKSNPTFSLDVAGNAFITGATTMSNTLNVSGKIDCSNALVVTSNLYVNGATSLSNNLNVYGTATVSNATILQSNLVVSGPSTFSNNVTFLSNLAILGQLTVSNVTYITSNIIVYSSETIQSNLSVFNIATLCNAVNIFGPTTLCNNVITTCNLTVNSNLIVTGTTFLSNPAVLLSNLSISGTMSCASVSTFNNQAIFNSNITLSNYGVVNIVTSNNFLGINTLSPSEAIDIATGNAKFSSNVYVMSRLNVGASNQTNGVLEVTGCNVGGDLTAAYFRNSSSNNINNLITVVFGANQSSGTLGQAKLSVGNENSAGGNGFMAFYTTSNFASAERLRVTSLGYLGIGTSNPSRNLHVYSSLFGNQAVFETTSNTGSSFVQFKNYTSSLAYIGVDGVGYSDISRGAMLIATINEYPVLISTSNQERARFTPDGLMGIGTNLPTYKVDVVSGTGTGTASNTAFRVWSQASNTTYADAIVISENAGQPTGKQAIAFRSESVGNTYVKSRIWSQIGASFTNTMMGFDVADATKTPQTRMVIDVNGNVGINNQSPSEKLQLSSGHAKLDSNLYVMGSLGVGTSNLTQKVNISGTTLISGTPLTNQLNANSAGSYILMSTTDNVVGPGLAIQNIASNNQAVYFDSYYNSNEIYTTTQTAFSIAKSNNKFVIRNAPGGVAGSAFTWGTAALTVLGTGFLGVNAETPSERLDVQGGNAKFGCNVYVSSNIGIGLSNPKYALDVIGDINFTGALNKGGSPFVGSRWSSNTQGIFYNFGPCNVGIGTSTLSEKFVVDSGNAKFGCNVYVSSNVGIGLSNPQYALDIIGDINFTGDLNKGGSPFVGSRWSSNTQGIFYNFGPCNVGIGTSTLSEKFNVDSGNAKFGCNVYMMSNVSIGKSNPAYALDVLGTAYVSGAMIHGNAVSNLSTMTTIGAATFQGVANFSNPVTMLSNVSINGPVSLSNTLGVSNVATFSSNVNVQGVANFSNPVTMLSNVSINGPVSFSNTLIANGIATFCNQIIALNNITVNGTTTLCNGISVVNNINLSNINSIVFLATSNNNLGLGRSNPDRLFTIGASSASMSNPAIKLLNWSNSAFEIILSDSNTGVYTYGGQGDTVIRATSNIVFTTSQFANGTWVFGSNVYLLNNFLGVGLSNPSERIDVLGNVKVTGNTYTVSNISIGTSNTALYRFTVQTSNDVPAINPDAFNINIVYEDTVGTSLRSGTLTNQAAFDNVNDYIQLTSTTTGSGEYYWQINPGNTYSVIFDHWAGGGTGSDYISFYSHCTAVPVNTSTPPTSASGYLILLRENTTGAGLYLYYNGVQLSYTPVTNLGNSAWHTTSITFFRNQFRISIDGILVMNYFDTTARNLASFNSYMGFGARGNTNFHRIRNIRIQKFNEGLWQYANQTSSSIVYAGAIGISTSNPSETFDLGAGNAKCGCNLYVMSNLGIGLSNPSYALDVTGNIRTNSNVIVSSTDSASAPGYTWNNDTNTGMYHVATRQLGFAVGGSNVVTITPLSNGQVTINSNLLVNGDTALGGNLTMSAPFLTRSIQIVKNTTSVPPNFFNYITNAPGITISNGSIFSSTAGCNSTDFIAFVTGSNPISEKMRITGAGAIGIGTSNPYGEMQIGHPLYPNSNNIVIEAGSYHDNTGVGWTAINFNGYYNAGEQLINIGKNRWRIGVDQRTTNDYMFIDCFTGTYTSNIITALSNGNVGFGTTPVSKMHIVAPGGELRIDGSNTFTALSLVNSSNGYASLGLAYIPGSYSTSAGSNDVILRTTSTIGKIHLQNGSGAAALTINSNNNVGVGMTTASYKLDVNGDINFTGVLRQSGVAYMPSQWSNSSANVFLMGSNVGIGTTSPYATARLHLAGPGLSNQLYFTVSNGLTNTKNWAFGPNAGTFFAYISDDTYTSTINWLQCTRVANTISNVCFPNGNIGVGTTNPIFKLDVSGQARITGLCSIEGTLGVGTLNQTEAIQSTAKIYAQTQFLSTSNDSASIPSYSFKEDSNTGMFHPSNDTIGFSTNGTERMRITDTGTIGIGTTAPGNPLTVNSTSVSVIPLSVTGNGTNASNTPIAQFINSNATSYVAVGNHTTSNVYLSYTSNVNTAQMGLYGSTLSLAMTTTGVGIGTTTPAKLARLHLSGVSLSNQLNFTASDGILNTKHWAFGPNGAFFVGYLYDDAYTGTTNWIQCQRVGTTVSNVCFPVGNVGIGLVAPSYKLHVSGGDIYCTGNITAFSDSNYKKDLLHIDNALDKVDRLSGYTFAFTNDKSDSAKRYAGLLAQDVQNILPEAVTKDEKGRLGLAYGNITALLVNAIKELRKEVQMLKDALGPK